MDIDTISNENVKKYFKELHTETSRLHNLANEARAKGYDPEPHVDIPLAAGVSQRVEALIGSIFPQILKSGVAERIDELENKYSPGELRIAFVLAEEIANQKFCKFEDEAESINAGVRTGFAYITQGVVSAPLEGLIDIKIKERRDGKKYLALYYAGPIRAAGGTPASMTVLIADYVRQKKGIDVYDPNEEEVKRFYTEVRDYCERVVRTQYTPSEEEITFLIERLPVALDGDPTEKLEVSNYKNLERVGTNRIRGGMCLVLSEALPLKAPKISKQIQNWAKDFGLENWSWLKEFIELKKQLRSGESNNNKVNKSVTPDFTYLSEIVAGRPVFGYPSLRGGFRLRYGRTRMSGCGSWAISPITMQLLNKYLATGSQLRVERPGKSTALTVCDSIAGPTVKLKDGSVLSPTSEQQAKKIVSEVSEILYLGDILISYGDFFEQAHCLTPPGYCPEWWAQELKKASKDSRKEPTQLEKELIENPFTKNPSLAEAQQISEKFNIPLHPKHTFFWDISIDEVKTLRKFLSETDKPNFIVTEQIKRSLELIGCRHTYKEERVILDPEVYAALKANLFGGSPVATHKESLAYVNSVSKYKIRDKFGTAIGVRMGRPEKAKLRQLKGSPSMMFPVSESGGRLRSLQSALEVGSITSNFPNFFCKSCNGRTIYSKCEVCKSRTELERACQICKIKTTKQRCHDKPTVAHTKRNIDINHYFNAAKQQLKLQNPPVLIKGVRGTSNKDHITEFLPKGLLRAKHKLKINKDCTIRYDLTELGITHFKPKEIGLSVERAKELGYVKDYEGKPLETEEQLIEIFPQDVILPSCPESADEKADDVLIRVASFVDEELKLIYGMDPIYNIKNREDLIGQLVIGLAPHTSAGIIGRIIGFSTKVCIFAHPFWHAAQRRDLDGEETCVMLAMDAFLNFSRQYLPNRRGSRSMDAPLVLTTMLDLKEVDDEVYDLDIATNYPLEFYEAALQLKNPWDIKSIPQVKSRVGKSDQYDPIGFTHPVHSLEQGVSVSAYKSIPTMFEKVEGQLDLAKKIRAVKVEDVAQLVIERHFIRDIKGNLRKYTMQSFRCVVCNEIHRRPPLAGRCVNCNNHRLVFTIAEGSVKKYVDATMALSKYENVPEYLQQSLEILQNRLNSVFEEEKTKQIRLQGFLS